MANSFLINKSGKTISVYADPDGKTVAGTISNREAFGYNRNWGGDHVFNNIIYLNSAGKLSYGYIIDPPSGVMTPCTDYPYGTATIEGATYKTFIMRKSRTIYTVQGNVWGTVGTNRLVACKTALAGDSHPNWKGINFVQNSAGKWISVTGDGATYGFVDTGLDVASGYSKIPFYGSW